MRERENKVARWRSACRLFLVQNTLKRELQLAIALIALVVACSIRLYAADIDESKLPPAAGIQVDFSRDIRPILENSCLKCHGPEKPKSGFQLTSRERALQGGKHGVDIVPGNSAKSPMIHYVSRIVEDMDMPPEGRGTPLTPEQIGLLRAWMDQGASWQATEMEEKPAIAATPIIGWTTVSGNNAKFRETYWQLEGWNGGLEQFELFKKLGPDSQETLSGHALLNDYLVKLILEQNDFGFARFGWEQYRRYYNDTGGYYPLFTPPGTALGQDLHLDIGRAWAEFGLTKPDWPVMTLGYEYQYREGNKSTLMWGPVTQNLATGLTTKNISPASESISEQVQIIKFDIEKELGGYRIEDNLRGEFYNLTTRSVNKSLDYGFAATTTANQGASHFQGANTLHVEKQFKDWLFASAGYYYSQLNGDATMDLVTTIPSDVRPVANDITLHRQSQAVSASTLLGPWLGFQLSGSAQAEWTSQNGYNNADADWYLPGVVIPPATNINMFSDLDRTAVSENVGLRYTKIPFTVLFAEARWQQESYGQYEQEDTGANQFQRDTDAISRLKNFRVGFNTSPWRRVSWGGSVQQYDRQTDYNNNSDFLTPDGSIPNVGYSAFIRYRQIFSRQAETKLTLRPNSWLQTTFGYQWLKAQYHTTTDPVPGGISDGGEQLDSDSCANIFSLGATLTPWRRLYMSVTFSYENANMVTVPGSISPSVAPYDGNLYSVLLSGNYALNTNTDLLLSYMYSQADFTQDNVADGLPLGVNYQQHAVRVGVKRKFKNGVTTGLQYAYYYYNEPSSGSLNNYQAQAVFATLSFQWR